MKEKELTKKTEKEILEMQNQHAFELKKLLIKNKRLLAIIGHDLKSPMGSIIGFLSFIKDDLYLIDKVKIEKYIDFALLSARKSFTLLDNLLEWAFTENAIKEFRQENIYLKKLLNEEIENIGLFATQKQINIKINNIPDEVMFVDINMIKTVIRNLLNNALKYTDSSGEIEINAKEENMFVEISIKDNGIGMEKDEQDKIFTTDGYTSKLGTNNESGTGFGLLLCKEFIKIHGGKIWIISEPGEGSEFKFTLPISSDTN